MCFRCKLFWFEKELVNTVAKNKKGWISNSKSGSKWRLLNSIYCNTKMLL